MAKAKKAKTPRKRKPAACKDVGYKGTRFETTCERDKGHPTKMHWGHAELGSETKPDNRLLSWEG